MSRACSLKLLTNATKRSRYRPRPEPAQQGPAQRCNSSWSCYVESWRGSVTYQICRTLISARTTGDGFFAECPRLCRVLFIGHSANHLFVECQRESTRQTTGTRQRGGLPSAEHSANNNTRQNWSLPSVILLTLGKGRRR